MMKTKITRRIVCAFLAGACLLSCACKDNGTGNQDADAGRTQTYTETAPYAGGVHQFNKTETDDYLIKDNKSDYQIVVPENAQPAVLKASGELQTLMENATGVLLDVVSEAGRDSNANYISLGDTRVSSEAGVTVEGKGLNSNGYVIKTVDKNIYVKGLGGYGVLWGSYELLTQTVGYIAISPDMQVFDENITDVKLYNYDIVDSPDFEWRHTANGAVDADETATNRYRWVPRGKEIYIGAERYHNYFYYIPKAMYNDPNKQDTYHPKWYSDDGTQLCLTAHGDEQEYELLVETMAMRAAQEIKSDEKMVLTITQEDVFSWCTCETCANLKLKYGTDSGGNIIFINDVAEKIENWLKNHEDENMRKKEVFIAFFAYMATVNAPVKKNEDGTYSPIDEEVVCRDNVAVFYAPIFSELAYGLDTPRNASTYEQMLAWASVCDTMGYWGYHNYYAHGQVMFPNAPATQSSYRTLLDLFNMLWIFDQGQDTWMNHSGFIYYKMFLQSQLQWDVNRDYNTIKNTFFKHYFKDASDVMMKFYDEYETNGVEILERTGSFGVPENTVVLKPENFPYLMLKQWMRYIDEAYESIAKYQTSNAELYQVLYDHITIESISVRYMILELYSGRLDSATLTEMKATFNDDCKRLNFNYFVDKYV